MTEHRPPARPTCVPARGFTLIELMVTLLIVAVILAIAVPSTRYITSSNRVAAEANGLLGDLQFARAQAIKEGQTVTVCSSANGTSCAGSTTWNTGWIVFNDPNGNQTVDTGEAVLRYQRPFLSTDTLTASNTVKAVTFNREGFAVALGAATVLTLHTAPANQQWTRCLTISLVGALQVIRYNGGTCT